ncbi:MAG: transglycosylase SLT domain-containing protein [Proteobacteria bacterium]|nr:transglycosylase SLT domain-containing protein [Pseudomonadota bacterium]
MKSLACLLLAASTFFLTACSGVSPSADSLAEKTPGEVPAPSRIESIPEQAAADLHRIVQETGEAPPLIWQRIAQNFAFSHLYDDPRVVAQKQRYLQRERLLLVTSQRSEPFIYFILNEIERRNMPSELAILPFIESGYYPLARSRSKATGLWQFTSQTAREFRLKRTCCYDARYDIHASTMAALDYLEELHAEFDQDWLLALMAYNTGPNRLKKVLRSSPAVVRAGDHWNLAVSRETREYVPKLLAFCAIVADPRLSRTLLYPVADAPHLEILETKKRISPAKLFKSADVSSSELRRLNPAMQHLHYPLPRGYRMLVPRQETELVALAMERLPEEPRWYRHRIAHGESLSVIAVRYGTTVSALRRANKLTSSLILAGKTLIIPH